MSSGRRGHRHVSDIADSVWGNPSTPRPPPDPDQLAKRVILEHRALFKQAMPKCEVRATWFWGLRSTFTGELSVIIACDGPNRWQQWEYNLDKNAISKYEAEPVYIPRQPDLIIEHRQRR